MLARILVSSLAMLAALPACAQFMAIPQMEGGFLVRSDPTVVLLRESPRAKAVLVHIPGGVGHSGYRADAAFNPAGEPQVSYGRMLKRLADPAATSGSVHVVAFDSPFPLPADQYLAARSSKDHMIRIESVVTHFRERYKLPVWIMGHSNGGYSIAEFLKHLQGKGKQDLVSGMVFSAGRAISRFGASANLPALFVSAQQDGCYSTSHADNRRLYEEFRRANRSVTEFAAIRGGEPQGDPCFTGIHMYHTAHDEVAKAIDAFLVRQLDPAGAAASNPAAPASR